MRIVDGWSAGEPDQIVYMSEQPYNVAAEGTVEYQFYTADPGWKEGKWIKVAEARPGNREIVHHILCFIMSDGGMADLDNSVTIGWAPGTPARVFDSNTAIHVPAGAKILFQLHYTPNGNGTLSVDEIPEQMSKFFGRLDMDDDGEVDAKEASVLVRELTRSDK